MNMVSRQERTISRWLKEFRMEWRDSTYTVSRLPSRPTRPRQVCGIQQQVIGLVSRSLG